MRILKKVALVFLSIVVILFVALFAIYQTRNYNAKDQLVHKESTAVLKIAVDDIVVELLKNAAINFSGFGEKSILDSLERKDWYAGISIPAYFYFYNVKDDNKAFFSFQRVKDEQKLIKLILREFDLDESDVERHTDYWTIVTKNQKVIFTGNHENLLIAFCLNRWTDSSVTTEMWANRANNMQKVGDIEALQEKAFSGDIAYINLTSKDIFALDFENGKIKTRAKLITDVLLSNKKNRIRKLDANAILTAYCNLESAHLITKYKSLFTSHSISSDSLHNSYPSYVDIQLLKGDVVQQDTIVVYDYNADFEMEERKTIQEELVPNIQMTLKGTAELYASIPSNLYYKVAKTIQDGYLILSTGSEYDQKLSFEESSYFFRFDYKKDDSLQKYFTQIPQLEKITAISLKGEVIADKTALIEGEIVFDNKNIHALKQIF